MALTADFERGILNQNVLTTDVGSFDKWDERNITGGSIIYDNTHLIKNNTLVGKFTFPTTSAQCNLKWISSFGTKTEHYGRIYLYLESYYTTGGTDHFIQ